MYSQFPDNCGYRNGAHFPVLFVFQGKWNVIDNSLFTNMVVEIENKYKWKNKTKY